MLRLFACLIAFALAPAALAQTKPVRTASTEPAKGDFPRFVASLWPEAQGRGVSRATFDLAFGGVTVDSEVIGLTKKQSEFSAPVWSYVASAASPARISRGQEVAARYREMLGAIERFYGVPPGIVLGIWGMETGYGANTGSKDVIRALASLAYVKYRGDFFKDQLLTALEILERREVARANLKGSWAGAMGHTQFMPTSYVRFAADGDGDGRRDIWSSIPDALASTANFLREHGWQPGLPWGMEVVLPEGFDYRNLRQGFASWSGLGVRRADGGALPRTGEATLFLPAGVRGPAFLVTANYDVIKKYNSSDAYALGVGHLGDRLTGSGPLRAAWPTADKPLDRNERAEIQRRLLQLRFYEGEVDGRLGSKTREAVRAFQLAQGLTPDGYADLALLKRLRAAAR
jgi:membrane-bound lytic murein transglycosylase B